jgi:hypothetical protein
MLMSGKFPLRASFFSRSRGEFRGTPLPLVPASFHSPHGFLLTGALRGFVVPVLLKFIKTNLRKHTILTAD